jgi:hypothetical protein
MTIWDQIALLKAADAAGLAMRQDGSETKALLLKMKKSYEKALSEVFTKHFETGHLELHQTNSKPKYQSIDDPLPEEHLYSRALEFQSKVLFRPMAHAASCTFFHDWFNNENGMDGAFSSNFDAQEFSRDELQRWLSFHGVESAYQFKKVEPRIEVDPPVQQKVDTKLLATPEELLRAFGAWGLKKAWFDCLGNHGWLFEARKRVGRGGNSPRKPLFCPLMVMSGLTTQTKPRKGYRQRISVEKGWKLLKACFPLVYEANAAQAPLDEQGLKYW